MFFTLINSPLPTQISKEPRRDYIPLSDNKDFDEFTIIGTPPPNYFAGLRTIPPPEYDSGYRESENYQVVANQLGIISEQLRSAVMGSSISAENQIIHTNITLTPNIRIDIATLRTDVVWKHINNNLEKINIQELPATLEKYLHCQNKDDTIERIKRAIENVLRLIQIGQKITNAKFKDPQVAKWLEANIINRQFATILHVQNINGKQVTDYQINWNKKTLEKLLKVLLLDPMQNILTTIQHNWDEPNNPLNVTYQQTSTRGRPFTGYGSLRNL